MGDDAIRSCSLACASLPNKQRLIHYRLRCCLLLFALSVAHASPTTAAEPPPAEVLAELHRVCLRNTKMLPVYGVISARRHGDTPQEVWAEEIDEIGCRTLRLAAGRWTVRAGVRESMVTVGAPWGRPNVTYL